MNDEIDTTAWRAMLLAHHRTVRAMESELDRSGAIPLTWYDVLLELRSSADGLRMQALSGRVVLSRTRVSRLVDELERDGLVQRMPDLLRKFGRFAVEVAVKKGQIRSTQTGVVRLKNNLRVPVRPRPVQFRFGDINEFDLSMSNNMAG